MPVSSPTAVAARARLKSSTIVKNRSDFVWLAPVFDHCCVRPARECFLCKEYEVESRPGVSLRDSKLGVPSEIG